MKNNKINGIDDSQQENAKLKKELAQKIRELEIEAALERVRARTMSMRKSEELREVIQLVYEQFVTLNIHIEHTGFIIDYKERDDLHIWLADHHMVPSEITIPWFDSLPNNIIKETKEKGRDFFTYLLTFEEKNKFYQDLFKFIPDMPEESLVYYFNCPGLAGSGVLLENVGLYIENFDGLPYSDEDNSTLMRFGKVFQQTYTRFLDLQKAEAQAREAQIEAALEKVRSRSLAMHKSDELQDVATVLREQMKSIGQPELEGTVIELYDLYPDMIESWHTFKPGLNENAKMVTGKELFRKDSCEMIEEMIHMYNSDMTDYTIIASGKKLKEFLGVLSEKVPEVAHVKMPDKMYWHCSDFSGGTLLLSSSDEPSAQARELLKRSSRVFDMAYRRFLDLQKSEAQAREAQIEVALERVRAQTMAMHKSEELSQVALSVLNQIELLEIPHVSCDINIVDNKTKDFVSYSAHSIGKKNDKVTDQLPQLNLNDLGFLRKAVKNKKNWGPHNTLELRGNLLDEMINLWKTSNFSGTKNQYIRNKPKVIYLHWSPFNNWSSISLSSVERLTEEQLSILSRFAKVFEQTYTRFLDLQKAEAQAREAEIQLALERVRARTMAMHKSEELAEVATVMFQQMSLLDSTPDRFNIRIINEQEKAFEFWATDQKGNLVDKFFKAKFDESPIVLQMYKSMKANEKILVQDLHGDQLTEWVHYIKDILGVPFNTQNLKEHRFLSSIFFSNGMIGITTNEAPNPLTLELIERFTIVFEQTYTRFLDLQKAETQAMEAEIHASLERVRASAMAMHKSEDLLDICETMFKEFSALGFDEIRNAIINIHNDSDNSFINYDYAEVAGKSVNHFTNDVLPFVSKINKATRSASDAFSEARLSGKSLTEFRELRKKTGQKDEPRLSKAKSLYFHFYSLGIGSIGISTYGPINSEKKVLLKRFRDVFNLSYKRYIDISKAEAQAREAEIQLALERVRARTMAMHKSEELPETSLLLFEQLKNLGEIGDQITIGVFNEAEGVLEISATISGSKVSKTYKASLDETYVMQKLLMGWKKGEKSLIIRLSGDELIAYNKYRSDVFIANNEVPRIPVTKNWIIHTVFFSKGFLSFGADTERPKESIQLFERFASAFDLTYTRFLDLQKAEAQAREAQIQLSLERVRARSLAMKSSDELHEVLSVLFRQFDDLGIRPVNVFLSLFDRDKRTLTYRASGKSGKRIPGKQVIEVDSMEILKVLYDKWLTDNSDRIEVIYYPKEVLPKLFDIFSETFSAMPEEDRMGVDDYPDGGYSMAGYTPYGYLGYDHQRQATEEEKEILSRFCIEFSRVYQRFLDIQRAEAQAREAQIEVSLERVRAKALAMHSSKDISETVDVFFKELKTLGIVPIRCGVGEIDEQNQTSKLSATTSSKQGDSYEVIGKLKLAGHPILDDIFMHWKMQKEYHPELKGANLTNYYKVMNPQVNFPDYPDDTVQYGSYFYFKEGLVFAWTEKQLTEEELQIFRRFTTVISLTYRRYMDLKEAEAQAREAQIEAALEKVRSRSLAMHTADELQDVVLVIVEKLQDLGVILDANGITLCTYFPNSKDVQHWIASSDYSHVGKYVLPYFDHVIFIEAWHSKESGDPYFSKVYTVEEKNSFFEHAFEHSDYKKFPEEVKQWILQNDQHVLSFAWQNNSAILIPSNTGVVPTEAEKEILIRFSKVFEQAYVRFMDLQKAEAQAREAQIEAALERVRSRSMAMHRTNELQDVINTVHQQLRGLDIAITGGAFIAINEEIKGELACWGAGGTADYVERVQIPLLDRPIYTSLIKDIKKGSGFFAEEFSNKEKTEFFKHLFKQPPYNAASSKRKKEIMSRPGGYARSCFVSKYTSIFMINHHGEKFSNQDNEILKRFGIVFEQTYTRFLDLQKAEAQAREAEIQLALERVRAQTMAMHSSNDMGNCILKMFDELTALGVDEGTRFGIGILNHDNENNQLWTARKEGEEVKMHIGNLDMTLHPLLKSARKAWKERVPLHKYILEGEDLLNYYQMLNALPDYKIQIPIEKLPKREFHYGFIFTHGLFYAFSPTEFRPDLIQIAQRFRALFEQTYTRFLDLQKAEERAREAQIETALERVRSRTMAMQKSEELQQVVSVLHEQLDTLDLVELGCELILCDEQNEILEYWHTNPVQIQQHCYKCPKSAHPFFKKQWNAWKKQESGLVIKLKVKEQQELNNVLFEHTGFRDAPDETKKFMRGIERPIFFTHAIMKYGLMEAVGYEPLTENNFKILERFTKSFEQTYTRFLDLQKAEAQAREAQIQLALERVRARTMAMHKSDELPETSRILFEQLNELGEPSDQLTIGIVREELNAIEISATLYGDTLKKIYNHSIDEPYMMNKVYKAWKTKQKTLIVELKGKELNAYNKYRNELTHSDMFPTNLGDENRRIVYAAFFSKGMLAFGTNELRPPQSLQLLERFASVFDLTYTRFLDLQKAEKQAREAQIEAALERVRAKSLAMHESQDLHGVVTLVYQQLESIGFFMNAVLLHELTDDKKSLHFWVAANGQVYPNQTHIPVTRNVFFTRFRQAQSNKESFYSLCLTKKQKDAWFTHYFHNSSHLDVPQIRQDFIFSCEALNISTALNKNTALTIMRYDKTPYDEEQNEVIRRFAQVFEQSYTRFLDLKKAEAQAREAQIEAALERVRAKTMAMHKSEELGLVAEILFDQLNILGIKPDRTLLPIVNLDDDIAVAWMTTQEGEGVLHGIKVLLTGHPVLNDLYTRWKKKEKFIEQDLQADKLRDFLDWIKKVTDTPYTEVTERRVYGYASFKYGMVAIVQTTPIKEETKEILHRFANVFEQTYTRFLDLQKAEAQAREAQIEVALERVRSRAMAMHHPNELSQVLTLLFEELDQLGVKTAWTHLTLIDLEKNTFTYRMTGREGKRVTAEQVVDIDAMDVWKYAAETFKSEKPDSITRLEFTPDMLPTLWEVFDGIFSTLPEGYKIHPKDFPNGLFTTQSNCKFGYLGINQSRKATVEEEKILGRFGNEFGRLYQRFLDLQNAEAQAREAQIEASLERVRSKAMAMHNSADLTSAAGVVFSELKKLGIQSIRSGVGLLTKESRKVTLYSAYSSTSTNDEDNLTLAGWAILENHPVLSKVYDSWTRKKDYFPVMKGKVLRSYYEQIASNFALPISHYVKTLPTKSIKDTPKDYTQFGRFISFSNGFFYAWGEKPADENEISILKRFASVIDLTFRRYFELQKAEAQAREAKIEAALERVRSRSMAMHRSDELLNVISVVSEQLQELKFKFDHASFAINNQKDDYQFWFFAVGNEKPEFLQVPAIDNPVYTSIHSALKRGDSFYSDVLSEEVNKEWTQHMLNHNDLTVFTPKVRERILNRSMARSIAIMPNIMLILGKYSSTPFTSDENDIIKRFANVFEQTYTRFLDLQKAEAQAREAKIEASLERVRAKAMAMHTSEAVGGAISVMFQELENLGIKPIRCGILIISENKTMQAWTTSMDGTDQAVNISGNLDMTIHPRLEEVFKFWKSGKNLLQYALDGQDALNYYSALSNSPKYQLPVQSVPKGKHYGNVFLFKEGGLFSYTRDPISEDEEKLYQRFTNVFTLTYRRYQDLKVAEQRAREAVRQSSLDRVRGEIASMRTSEDLNRITPVIWRELQALEVPFFRCGVFIVNEKEERVQMFLTTPEGKALGVLNLALDANDLTYNIVKSWKKKHIYKTHWDKEEFISWTKSLMELGQVKSAETYQGASSAPESLNLHFVPFKQGMLYVGDVTPLTDEKLELVKTLAESFSIAYSRYEDFINLEEAKTKTEVTLNELKAAQNQLVQSEKMASLGELTAGIAHEIQNPLNFVNNFSEVSKELLDEMMEELKKGDIEEVEAIAKDIIENLEKINHHGKRADGIVKGMLQHSRTSTGIKEPTNINVLADEYLRLAYHGLRAKDKSFNAIMKTDFDDNIGKIDVIAQDIGRVILNLITNAFYAVTEKKKQLKDDESEVGYEPTVTVGTKKLDNAVEITVEDNGNGIPKKLIDKIFQPFFTTKPTGSGTGLGLSLSYDIVKAHGGEIKVETKEGEGTTFKILL